MIQLVRSGVCLAIARLTTCAILLGFSIVCSGAESEHSSSEESEPGIDLGNGIVLSTQLEFETSQDRFRFRRSPGKLTSNADDGSLALNLTVGISQTLHANFNFVADFDDSHGALDEYVLLWEPQFAEDWAPEFSLGLQELPFAQTNSRFISDPLHEFGQIDARSLLAHLPVNEWLSVSGGVYQGKVARPGTAGKGTDWSLLFAAELDDRFAFSLGYLSDLADASSQLLEDEGNRSETRVPALSALASVSGDGWQLSLEGVRATRRFAELDEGFAKPQAWNLELAWFPRDDLDIAFRFEESRDLSDEPHQRYGIAATWRFHPNATFALEWLRGDFAAGVAFDDDDNEIRDVNIVGAQLTIRF